MVLRFFDHKLAYKFVDLCRLQGYHGTITREGEKLVVTVDVDKKQSKSLTRRWAEISMVRS